MQLKQLAEEIRKLLIGSVSKTGGHLASNLGAVELTIALHFIFDSPKDKIIWDVGHQSYTHKILTGRKERFGTLRTLNGISGFPKASESEHDIFNTGHSSTSISAALGLAKARDIKNENYSVISVIGDGALTGGMAFEALNDAGRSLNNLIVVLNDNNFSIRQNVGGLSKHLAQIRTEPAYFKSKELLEQAFNRIPGIGEPLAEGLNRIKGAIKYMIMHRTLFEELGFKYFGPIDGHDLNELIDIFSKARFIKGPVLIHVRTQKGKGYGPAEEKPHAFHNVSSFEIRSGETLNDKKDSYSAIFGKEMVKLAGEESKLIAITAAMPDGTGLNEFSKKYPKRFFDVGIAEQHAVTFAAGMAKSGLKPVFAVYSSFLQRAYDQILHDVAAQNLHVTFAIDRAGVVGEDGETHQGIYDLSYLSHIPNMSILSPCDYSELEHMLRYAVIEHNGPIAIRYPRGKGKVILSDVKKPVAWHKGIKICNGTDVTIVTAGNMVETSLQVAATLKSEGISVDLINVRFLKPMDAELIIGSAMRTKKVVTIEDHSIIGGLGSNVLQLLNRYELNIEIKMFGFPDHFIGQGTRSELFRIYKLDADSLIHGILRLLRKNKLILKDSVHGVYLGNRSKLK
ncbi:1-deoxy-D-xylulose-5-phosphate synthase [Geosporobacter ferrireducens]|jgi:1-deoxy-D-xylulose-5-phosphate synthase|uniref:1-deoxy-D-xylulose-5-phosphate synthase n=2 Tax=Geosporobacter ferrireducens TaxID=1424294 RepID=A0A1D8GQA2_9FIRM|nr:1-deoxy-D-xylulose-5-phosphate synthase [Geosporobacter ferrireducens]